MRSDTHSGSGAKNFALLLVDDDSEFREMASCWFAKRGYEVTTASSAEEALPFTARRKFDVGIFDLRMPGLSGLDLLRQIKETDSEIEVLLLTGEGTIETAVEALKLGAYDYLLKPCRLEELERRCRLACETGILRQENRNLRSLVERARPRGELIGQSPAMQEIYRLIGRLGPSDKPILIEGESGTGKELVARALQNASPRADRPLVTVNCAALPEQLLESELFGHERGAFTGAVTAKPGLFEAADGGTLFIDEVGELALPLQAKFLRTLEDGSFRRVGSLKERHADVRILAATNRSLAAEVSHGRFREDLYYRVNVLSLRLPPLRERAGDIDLLIRAFLGKGWEVTAEAQHALTRYHWPGNVRQLKNLIERAKILSDDGIIAERDLPPELLAASEDNPLHSMNDDLNALEREHVLTVLRREGGNKARAARALGVNRRSLYRMLERFGFNDGQASSVSEEACPREEESSLRSDARISR